MNQLIFYLQYASRNLWRNRRWSAFAMFSVAAGVATMVALRSLGLGIGDSLTSNVRSSNHGDITLEKGSGGFTLGGGSGLENVDFNYFTDNQLSLIRSWIDDNNAVASEYTSTTLQVTALNRSSAGLLNFMTAVFIDPETYPPTQDIFALEPTGVQLGDLFEGGLEVVISENLAQNQNILVGDEVRVSGTSETFLVRGIVPTNAEAGLRDPFAAFFGFVYLSNEHIGLLSLPEYPNRISIALPDGTSNVQIESSAHNLNERLSRDGYRDGFVRIITVPRLLEQNEIIADITGRFVVVMGLGAMLLGGVGIINTMLILVRRRANEIASLKTFGLKGHQVAALFMTEAMLLGLIGSVIGAIVGSLLSLVTNSFGETFIQQSIPWRLYPEALVFGLVVGLVVTAVFGVIPVLTAVKVRPGIILRPNETHVPALGVVQSLLALVFVVFSLGLIAGQIIGPLPSGTPLIFGIPLPPHLTIGLIGVAATLLILGILLCILWVVVWIVGKMPTFGSVDLRLALVNLRSHRMRTATTLLAISTGMFALSSITFYGASAREIVQFNLSQTFGGNILVLSPASAPGVPDVLARAADRQLDNRLAELDGVEYRTRISTFSGQIIEVDAADLREEASSIDQDALISQIQAAAQRGDFDTVNELSEQIAVNQSAFISITMNDTNNPNMRQGDLIAGRHLTLEDHGQSVAVILMSDRLNALGIELGSHITLSSQSSEFTLEVVGLIGESGSPVISGTQGDIIVPGGALPGLRPNFRIDTVQAHSDQMDEVLLGISSMVGFFPVNIAFIDGVIGQFIDQFSALPILVGLLSLAAAAVIMANTVALATLERRQQIGILKAVGLKSRRVLSIMLLENTLISLLGGILGIGLSALGVLSLSLFGLDELVLIPRDAQPVALALILTAAFIGGMATFLSANVAVRERVLNVLRYE